MSVHRVAIRYLADDDRHALALYAELDTGQFNELATAHQRGGAGRVEVPARLDPDQAPAAWSLEAERILDVEPRD